ncbi:MAG: hypothetical protein J7M40_00865 [Planctomycetes bacterium]|nr:hypothetical protein [Planctomycetota bacterium]
MYHKKCLAARQKRVWHEYVAVVDEIDADVLVLPPAVAWMSYSIHGDELSSTARAMVS